MRGSGRGKGEEGEGQGEGGGGGGAGGRGRVRGREWGLGDSSMVHVRTHVSVIKGFGSQYKH